MCRNWHVGHPVLWTMKMYKQHAISCTKRWLFSTELHSSSSVRPKFALKWTCTTRVYARDDPEHRPLPANNFLPLGTVRTMLARTSLNLLNGAKLFGKCHWYLDTYTRCAAYAVDFGCAPQLRRHYQEHLREQGFEAACPGLHGPHGTLEESMWELIVGYVPL